MTPPLVVTDTISSIASTLLQQAGAALDEYGIKGFSNRLVLPGRDAAWDVPGSLVVLLVKANMGNIGVEEFLAAEPGSEALARNVAAYAIELWQTLPAYQASSVAGGRPPANDATTKASLGLMDAAWTIYAWLEQLQWQNQLFPFKPIMVGPVEPLGPQGDFAGMTIAVQVELG